jgi:methyl-accepting chemotaxis protein
MCDPSLGAPQVTIAAAVEEQTLTTQEKNRNVADLSQMSVQLQDLVSTFRYV